MTNAPNILLIVPEETSLTVQADRITVRRNGGREWVARADQLPGFSHLAAGPVRDLMSSEALREAARHAEGRTVLILPLEGYEWLSDLQDVLEHVLAAVRIQRGVLWISPIAGGGDPPSSSERAVFRLCLTSPCVGRPLTPFVLPRLVPTAPLPQARDTATPQPWIDRAVRTDSSPNAALRAGLALADDDLDTSHRLAQSIEGDPDGDYWHAIMHRREPDDSNSKYWFRRIGKHLVFADLAPRAAEILSAAPSEVRQEWSARLLRGSRWDPLAFVDMCAAAAADEDGELGLIARRIQWVEMRLLLKHTAAKVSAE